MRSNKHKKWPKKRVYLFVFDGTDHCHFPKIINKFMIVACVELYWNSLDGK